MGTPDARRRRSPGRAPAVVRAQRWDEAAPDGTAEASEPVSVVIPARDCQEQLDRTLAALAFQTYPADLLEVVVVDDRSDPPLQLPDIRPTATRLLRRSGGEAHGSGPARHLGATEANGAVLLFLDADMVATARHVEAHMAWHLAMDHALVLGTKRFVDFDGIGPAAVAEAVRRDALDDLLADRPRQDHRWQEDVIRQQGMLTEPHDDAFITVVGADLSIRADLYAAAGGFSAFGLRGIVDTEFGYRAYTRGAVLVPEQETLAYHQGARSFSTSGAEIKRERTGLAANFLPVPMFRPSNRGRRWAVPSVTAFVVPTAATAPEATQLAVDALLASDWTDLVVSVVDAPGSPVPRWLHDYFAHDGRVAFHSQQPRSGFPSPYTAVLAGEFSVSPSTLTRLLDLLAEHGAGTVRTELRGAGPPALALHRTRALERVADYTERGRPATVGELFGELLVRADDVGVSRVGWSITPQGMLKPEGT